MRKCPGLSAIVIVVTAVVLAASGGAAADQTPQNGNLQDLRPDLYNGNAILDNLTHALPAFAIGALTFIVVMRFLGVLEMGGFSVFVLLAMIGGIIWKFYWPRGY